MSITPKRESALMSAPEAKSLESTAPGRSARAEQRRVAFLDAAREVFLEQGYEAASMAEIVSRAGGSLSTLYSQFGDKEGLFLAVVERRVKELSNAMALELSAHTPAEEGLRRIGQNFVAQLLTPAGVGLYRIILGLAPKFPELSRQFYEKGLSEVRDALAEYLRDREQACELKLRDPLRAAHFFLEMVRGTMAHRALLNPGYFPDAEEINSVVEDAVSLFLDGLRQR
ncbi:TetR/AcrR family transcriptional regulator [Hyphomonas sp. WL0036]|uniref:TetR/AcrR family transcriptional regulator n=1 Tax=Hyphomonas sediminis TaxID=2866160 RepID=UPI001C7EF0E6|nr:TetR/AcrR family transcriptional regulator [Hyphomonas sediminis]MBY9065275.1 TetR/AcrR family transcriptional regulator [Hyphomonas sediminis]